MKDTSTIVFTGDIGFDRYMDGKWADKDLLSADVLDFLAQADHVVTNVEGPVIAQPKNTVNSGVQQLLHAIDPRALGVLRNMGADIWNICNNHIMDAGEPGVQSTLAEARAFGAQTIGAGMNIADAVVPVILDEAGGVGLFGAGYQRACRKAGPEKAGCVSWSDMNLIQDIIDGIKRRCRWCVAVIHGGEEFTALPSPYTRDRYLEFLKMGADVVVAHHPHVPMNYETVGDKVIFYSLGNFIFDTDYQRAQFNTEKGLLVKLNFTPDRFTWEPMGLAIVRGPEHVVKAPLPRIFRDVGPRDYELLAPLAAKIFIANTKRQQTFLFPEKYTNATEEMWRENFSEPLRSGRVPGEVLDFAIVCPLAEKEAEKAWQQSDLEDVKNFMLEQL